MKRPLGRWWQAAAGLGLLLALWAHAQVAPPPSMALLSSDPAATAYRGPRYPSGPDSLRATVRRYLRAASPALVGELFLHLELDSTGRSQRAYFLPPPAGSPAIALYLSPEAQGPGVTVALPFGPEPAVSTKSFESIFYQENRIIGSAGLSLDAGVLRVTQLIPHAQPHPAGKASQYACSTCSLSLLKANNY